MLCMGLVLGGAWGRVGRGGVIGFTGLTAGRPVPITSSKHDVVSDVFCAHAVSRGADRPLVS